MWHPPGASLPATALPGSEATLPLPESPSAGLCAELPPERPDAVSAGSQQACEGGGPAAPPLGL